MVKSSCQPAWETRGCGAFDQGELLDAEELAAMGRVIIGGVLGAIEPADIAGGEPVEDGIGEVLDLLEIEARGAGNSAGRGRS